jgi:hypothetical protein
MNTTKITIPETKIDDFIENIERIFRKYGLYIKYSEGKSQELLTEIITDLTEINREITKIKEDGKCR